MASIHDNPSAAAPPNSPECAIRAFGVVEATHAQISELRNKPHQRHLLPAKLLKYADDQTVVAVAAVLHAIHDGNLQERTLADWGVVAGPRFLGRDAVAGSMERFRRRGALGVSPVHIPYLSLHAVSGMVSLALRIHGPNVGVGGARTSMTDALLTGLTLQQEHRLPGVFVVISAWDPEPTARNAPETERAICRAVSLVLMPGEQDSHGLKLRIHPGAPTPGETDVKRTVAAPPSLMDLAQFLAKCSDPRQPQTWCYPWCWNGHMEITRAAGSLVAAPEATDIHDVGPARAA